VVSTPQQRAVIDAHLTEALEDLRQVDITAPPLLPKLPYGFSRNKPKRARSAERSAISSYPRNG
jgi:hypothetical protein